MLVYRPNAPLFKRLVPYFLYRATSTRFFLPIVRLQLLRIARQESDLELMVDFAFKYVRPFQIREELKLLLGILSRLKPKVILEIGTAQGGTLFLFARIADPNAELISIDLPGQEMGTGYGRWRIPLYKAFARPGQRIQLFQADSHLHETFDRVTTAFGPTEVDLLFIDGDHTYEGVRKDFDMYSPLVRDGGIIVLHDIVHHPPEARCEVDKLWREIKRVYETQELIEDKNQTWAGIGIVRNDKRVVSDASTAR